MWDRIKTEPAVIMGLVNAAIVLIVAFGVNVTDTQTEAILSVVAAIISVVTGVAVRQQVTPLDKRR